LKKKLLGTRVLAELLPRRPRHNLVVSLLTIGEDGYPNVCLLSPYQVVAKDDQTILLAVYEGSKTSANLAKRRSATLVLFLPPAAYYIKGNVETVSPKSPVPGNVFHKMRVTRATKDYYRRAPVTSTVTFEEGNVLADYSRVFQGLVEAANQTT
jgi:hypothetical protein